MSQASSATFPISLSGTQLPIPPKPLFQNFQFKVIGKEPALLMRLSNNTSTELDDFDVDDIYEEPPLPSSGSMATENVSRGTCSRPTLLQTLASDDELSVTDANDPSASMDVVNFPSLPASLQSISSDIPKLPPNTASPLPIPPSGTHRLWTSSVSPGPAPQNTACAGSSINSRHSDRSDRDSKTHTSSHPPPNGLILSPSNQDLRPVDNFKALKKVVVLKDKFRAVSATARQSQRLAKHALINAQRSAAAAQTCLAAAESFVPCVGDVISAIRRMRPGSADGPASEWTAVLRDLEDDLYDLRQWSSFDTFGRDTLGQNSLHLRDAHLIPFGGMARESCSGFPLTSVEEEAQEALKAWNQLDRKTHVHDCPADLGRSRLEPGLRSDDRVSPESHIHHAQRLGMEGEAENFQHLEIKESGTRVSKEVAEASTGNLDKDGQPHGQEILQAGGRQTVEADDAMQPRGEVEKSVPLIATEAADAQDCQERQGPQDDQMQDQQQLAQSCEESHHSPGSRGEGSVPIVAASSDIRSAASKKTLAGRPQPGSASPRCDTPIGHIQATSKLHSVAPSALQDRSPRNLQAALITPATEGNLEQTPASTSNLVSSDDMQAETQPMYSPSLPSALPDDISVAPKNGVDPSDRTSANQAHLATPIPTSNSEAVGDGGVGKTVIPLSEITPGSQTSDQLRDVSRTSPIKTEPVEPQLNFGVGEYRVVDGPLVSIEVKPPCNVSLKPDSEMSAVSVPLSSSPDECEIGTKPSDRVSSVDLPAPLPNGPPAMKQKPPEVNIAPSIGPITSDSVATRLTSPHNVANNDISAQLVLSNTSASASSQLTSVPVRSPISPSAVPLALRVERPTSYPSMRDLDDSIGPDLMYSRGWDADENDGSRRSSRRSPSKFEPGPRGRSRDLESRNQYVDLGSRSMTSHSRNHMPSLGSRSPDGRRPISSYEYPTPLIGKKRPRDEPNHPSPSHGRRDWTGATYPSVSENQVSHISQVDINANPRLGLLATPISEPSYNSNNSSRHPAPSLINRLDPSSESTVQVANPSIQRPFRPQQPPQTQNKPWQNSGYNVGQASYGRRGHQGYDNDRTPELLSRMTSSQQFQHGHNMFDSGHSANIGPSNRSHGRGRSFGGQRGAFQQQHQQHFSRKPPSLYDRLDNKP